MHRDVDAGTYADDRIDGHLWLPPYWDRVSKMVKRAMRKAVAAKPANPFTRMLSARMPANWRSGG